jgi:hypothetical protein
MIYLIAFLAVLAHVFFGVLLSREAIVWPRLSLTKRSFLLLAIWFMPVVGAVIAYKTVKLDWFRKTTSNGSVPAGILGEMDAAFNPGARHTMEARQEARIERR